MKCTCGSKTHGTYLCSECTKKLGKALTKLPEHYADLQNVRLGLTNYSTAEGARPVGDTRPLPIDLRFVTPSLVTKASGDNLPGREGQATQVINDLHSALGLWASILLTDQAPLAGPTCEACLHLSCAEIRRREKPRRTVPGVCDYLRRNLSRIAARSWGPTLAAALSKTLWQVQGIVDRPDPRWYAGPCAVEGCNRHLYARTGAQVVQCACGASYDVGPRRDYLLSEAEQCLATADELASAVSWLGAKPLTAERVRKWAERGRIVKRSTRVCGKYGQPDHKNPCRRCQPVYLIADAIDLLAAETVQKGA